MPLAGLAHNKIALVYSLVKDEWIDLACLTETWLGEDSCSVWAQALPPGYCAVDQVSLGSYFYINRFLVEVQKCKDSLTCASIALYYRMFRKMLPTPAKCHYTFNLRDLFKVLKGLLQAHKSVIVSKETTALLFVNECTRVFHDRLIDSAEKEMFYQFLSNELRNYFKLFWSKEKLMEDPPIFVDFLEPNTHVEKRIYRNITNQKRLLLVLEEYYMRMQAIHPEVGLDGNGKVTSASLACYLSECSLYKLSISRTYNHGNFRDDLKAVYKKAGLEGKRTVFLITDSDIIQESFLEDLSCILKSGQVPNLFEKEELDNIIVPLTSVAEKAKHPNKIENIYSFFLERVRTNLHVVFTTSAAGLVFRQRCRTYPAIVNCCTIDWYDAWPEEALCHVAKSYFRQDDTLGDEVGVQLSASVHSVALKCHLLIHMICVFFVLEKGTAQIDVTIVRSCTESLRKSNCLFLKYSGCDKGSPVGSQRLSKWIMQTIELAYQLAKLDLPVMPRGHSTRTVAASSAFTSGIPIQDICKAATWTAPCTFARYYRLDVRVRHDCSFGRAILSSVLH
ncbi:Dynein heavy chain 6, axonemal [Varanus komodoensis]|nr:Dynein heavy chain 6, axonemal [Varanus komodoensis]